MRRAATKSIWVLCGASLLGFALHAQAASSLLARAVQPAPPSPPAVSAELPAPMPPPLDGKVKVTAITFSGLKRTDPAWLADYVAHRWPAYLDQDDIAAIVRKILTTAVYTEASARLEPNPQGRPDERILRIDVTEKWTTIPVVRAAVGGGTPLGILGFYDTHTLGRLITVGSEAQKYGDAPIGFVVYTRVPRLDSGRWFLGGDVWREFRRRSIYAAREAEPLGEIGTASSMARVVALGPLEDRDPALGIRQRAGLDFAMLQEEPVAYEPAPGKSTRPPEKLHLPTQVTTLAKILPSYVYDDVEIDNIVYDGTRLSARAGPLLVAGNMARHSVAELEAFHYTLLPGNFNAAVRAVASATSYISPRSQYFLGGLDTIRGIPDGGVYGTKALYFNSELRHLSLRSRYVWLQSLVFADAGTAANEWSQLRAATRSSAGLGVRLAIPQVTRLMFRIDYAWSIDGSRTQGLTAGLNQFFDPYRPL